MKSGNITTKTTGAGSTIGTTTESYLYDGFQVIAEYNTDNQHIKRRYIYAEGIDEPVAMIVEPDHQGWYGLEEYSTIANSWLCDPNDAAYDAAADYAGDDVINVEDLAAFVDDYFLTDRPLAGNPQYYGYVFDGSANITALTFKNDPNETSNPNEQPYFAETYAYDPFGAVTIYDANSIVRL
jgi:hypothetical protein